MTRRRGRSDQTPPALSLRAPERQRMLGQTLQKTAGRSAASKAWLLRQLNDPYVAAAKAEGLRSRAAYKLLELDKKFRLLQPKRSSASSPRGPRIVDLGAAPGGWSQVIAEKLRLKEGSKETRGLLIAIDILPMDPIAGATVLQGDFTDEAVQEKVLAALAGSADLVLSDMASPTIGHAATDHLRIMALAEIAMDFAERTLSPGGAFVVKLFKGGAEKTLLDRLRKNFAEVRHAKPPASRKESAESYIVATGFRGTISPGRHQAPIKPDAPAKSAASEKSVKKTEKNQKATKARGKKRNPNPDPKSKS